MIGKRGIEQYNFILKKYLRYFFVGFVLLLAFIWHQTLVLPTENVKKSETPQKKSVVKERPDLDEKNEQKIYAHIFESQLGDSFRLGVHIKTKDKEEVEVFVRSVLNTTRLIANWTLEPIENGQYKEIVFSTPERYQDVIIRLKKNTEISRMEWYDPEIYIKSVSLTRLDRGEKAQNLNQTFFGLSTINKQELFSEKNQKSGSIDSDWVFRADGNFLQAVEFAGTVTGGGRFEYDFELYRYNNELKAKEPEALQKATFILDALDDLRTSSGNYLLPFPFPLKQGDWYELALVKGKHRDPEHSFRIGELEKEINTDQYAEKGNLLLHIGNWARMNNDAVFPDGAKLEDLGKNLSYSFSLQQDQVDYTNLYEVSSSIHFDQDKERVIGNQRKGEFYTYKFNTAYPFETLAIEAIQEGDDEKEIRLEYSFENKIWKEIPFIEETVGFPHFALILEGNGSKVLYVRISYEGENKTSGFFGLKRFSVNASIPKPR